MSVFKNEGSNETVRDLTERGFALDRTTAADCVADPRLIDSWARLPPDLYLKDRGRYRFRRHASIVMDVGGHTLTRIAHRPHWQPTTYNALHGGIRRWFEPIEDRVWACSSLQSLVLSLGETFCAVWRGTQAQVPEQWFVEAHQFRIDASQQIGKPTPEGAHRDGVDFVAVLLVARVGVVGGHTTVYSAKPAVLWQHTLDVPGQTLLMDDARVQHETTPIVGAAPAAYRDTLVLTYRANGFLDPE